MQGRRLCWKTHPACVIGELCSTISCQRSSVGAAELEPPLQETRTLFHQPLIFSAFDPWSSQLLSLGLPKSRYPSNKRLCTIQHSIGLAHTPPKYTWRRQLHCMWVLNKFKISLIWDRLYDYFSINFIEFCDLYWYRCLHFNSHIRWIK